MSAYGRKARDGRDGLENERAGARLDDDAALCEFEAFGMSVSASICSLPRCAGYLFTAPMCWLLHAREYHRSASGARFV